VLSAGREPSGREYTAGSWELSCREGRKGFSVEEMARCERQGQCCELKSCGHLGHTE
jgi:hypothetical protein